MYATVVKKKTNKLRNHSYHVTVFRERNEYVGSDSTC